MNILLLVVILVLGIGVFIGYKKGLVKMIASLLATVLIVALVGMISPYVSQWIQKGTPLKESVQNKVVGIMISDEKIQEEDLSREEQINLIENADVPETFRQSLLENNNEEAYMMLGAETFAEYIGSYIAKVLSDAIAFLISLVVVTIVVSVVIKMLGIIDKLPLIGGMNRFAGGIAGIGVGILLVWILFAIITLLYDTSLGAMCFENIETNSILSFLYENNPLMKFITKF